MSECGVSLKYVSDEEPEYGCTYTCTLPSGHKEPHCDSRRAGYGVTWTRVLATASGNGKAHG